MDDYRYATDARFAMPTALEVARRYRSAHTRIAPVPETREWDPGLQSGVRIVLYPDHRNKIPERIEVFVQTIKAIEKLSPNWDSYQALPLHPDAQLPALELAVLSNERCNYPSVVPLPNGGLGLRWVSPTAELEIDVSANGTCEALLEFIETGDEIELPRGSALSEAKALLARFNKVG
jgi:hypothetical protein